MSRAQLAYELHRYLTASLKEEPPAKIGPVIDNQTVVERKPTKMDVRPQKDALMQLSSELQTCTKCSLSENRTNVVVGEGNVSARIMVVGEAPGAVEDEQGIPFVGPSGQLLRGGFKKIKLPAELLYITNVVKCRPPDNRNPRVEELTTCRPYLDRQLELVDPDVLLPLGNFGLRYFLGEDKNISSARGRVYEWEGRKLVPTYHPAYILRNRTQAQLFIDDLKLAADQLK
ncbi:MAG: uracil-DNA glycosylase family protein [bacterium]